MGGVFVLQIWEIYEAYQLIILEQKYKNLHDLRIESKTL